MIDLIGFWFVVSLYTALIATFILAIGGNLLDAFVRQATGNRNVVTRVLGKYIEWWPEDVFITMGIFGCFVLLIASVCYAVAGKSFMYQAIFLGTYIGPYAGWVAIGILGYTAALYITRRGYKLSQTIKKLEEK